MLSRTTALLSAFAFALVAAGCSADATSSGNTGVTSDNLVVANVDVSDMVSVFPDHLEIPKAGHDDLAAKLTPGKILSGMPSNINHGQNPSGFLRMVSSVHTDGTMLFVETTNASLTDAIVLRDDAERSEQRCERRLDRAIGSCPQHHAHDGRRKQQRRHERKRR